MPEVTDHKPSTPSWVDLASPDIEASARFYGQLFGWETQRVGGPEMGSYSFFNLRGKSVSGLVSIMMPNQPTAWSIYFASDNIDQTAEKIRSAGGTVMMGPDDIPNAGRLGFFGDPAGAAFGVFQAGAHRGAGIVMEPNTLAWAELETRDVAAVKSFYMQVFGWDAKASPMGPGMPDYTEWQLSGESIAGAMPMSPDIPAQVPSHWMPYFGADNADRVAGLIVKLGGKVTVGPMDFPGGRFAFVSDPQGAAFGILESRS